MSNGLVDFVWTAFAITVVIAIFFVIEFVHQLRQRRKDKS